MKICRNNPSFKRCSALLLVILMITAFCLPVSAKIGGEEYTIYDTNMTITLPKDTMLLSMDTPADDPVWGMAGILDPSDKVMQLSKDGILAEIYAFDKKCHIVVTTKESKYSNAIYNLNALDEEQKKEFLKYMNPSSQDGKTKGTIEWYEHEQIPFFRMDICSTAIEDSGEVYERLYGTLYDGKVVSFDMYNGTEKIPEEYDALLREIIDSAVISEFKEVPSSAMTPESLWVVLVLFLLIAMIVAFFVYRTVSNKREKKQKAIMADQIAAYRQKKIGHEDEGEGELLFVNETVHDDNAIKTFANFHAYRHHILYPILTIVMGVVALYLAWAAGSSSNWWMIVLLFGCVIYSGYKTATAGTTITKSLIRVFSKMRSRKAAYYFYEKDFRITGLQASNLHPYFQITRMYETKEYFYMYFGESNTYYIKKDGFTQGDVDGFRAFMKEKLGKNFK